MTDFETLKSTLKEEILKELSFKTEGHELKTRKTKKNEKNVEGATEEKPVKPKRKGAERQGRRPCTEKQLAALAAGRQKNPRWIAKRMKEEEEKKKQEERTETDSKSPETFGRSPEEQSTEEKKSE